MTASAFLRIAAAVAALQFAAHTSLVVFSSPKHGPEEVAVVQAMKSQRFNFLGSHRSYWDFYFGYALEAAFICLIEAVLFWQLAGGASTNPLLIRSIAALFILFNTVHVLLAWRYFFITPIIPDLVIIACLGLALLKAAA
jgi:hypothetical protein